MAKPARTRIRRSQRARRRPRRTVGLLATTAALVVFAASTALAAHLALTLGSSANATLGERVVVNAQGRTLYTLSPETSRRLLCKTSACLTLWPPLTVGSTRVKLKNGAGVHGRLGILRRANGTLQVTLRGLPLYRYSKDRARGQANGEGLQSFGGTWHAMTAVSGESPRKPAMTPPPVTPPPPSYPSSPPSETTTTTPSPPTTTTPTTTTTTTTTPTPPPYPYPPY